MAEWPVNRWRRLERLSARVNTRSSRETLRLYLGRDVWESADGGVGWWREGGEYATAAELEDLADSAGLILLDVM